MKVEVELPDPPPGKQWMSGSKFTRGALGDSVEVFFSLVDIPKPKRVIYHETGEFRPPQIGEFFKSSYFDHCPERADYQITGSHWILRREEVDS